MKNLVIKTTLGRVASGLCVVFLLSARAEAALPGTEWVEGIEPPSGLSLPTKSDLVVLPRKKPEVHTVHESRPLTRKGFRGLNRRLLMLLSQVERHFGQPVQVTSGCRSIGRNKRIGGARKSFHIKCMAADIKVANVSQTRLKGYLKRLPGRGGVGTYCNKSIVHIDVGPKRSWHHGCRKKRRYASKRRK